jgi:hypothetical protein
MGHIKIKLIIAKAPIGDEVIIHNLAVCKISDITPSRIHVVLA